MAGMERFTQRARRVLSLAHQEAQHARCNFINTEHLLIGLMVEEGGVASRVLHELGLTTERVREVVGRVTTPAENFDPSRVEIASDAQQALEYAIEEARRLSHNYIGTEHILLGIIRVESAAMDVLRRLGVTADQIRRQTRRVLNENATITQNKHSPDKAFEKLKQIFILHGQDEWKKTVASLVQKLGLVPVILDNEHEDWTITTYLDMYSKDIALAVMILMNKDSGVLQSGWRGDRNFIYELGYFHGKLGRNRTCVLYSNDFQENVELLSAAFMDVIFIPLDTGGAWMTKLAKAIQDTGTETNLNQKI